MSIARVRPALRFSHPPKMAVSSLIAVELRAMDSLKCRDSCRRMKVEHPCAPWRRPSIRSIPRYASVAPSAGEFFCGLTVAGLIGALTREAARSSACNPSAWFAAAVTTASRSSPVFSQGSLPQSTGQMGLLTVRSSCFEKVTIPSYPA